MQTSFSQHPYAPELFTRERRQTRMRHFLEAFDRKAWGGIPLVPDLLPLRASDVNAKATEWTRTESR